MLTACISPGSAPICNGRLLKTSLVKNPGGDGKQTRQLISWSRMLQTTVGMAWEQRRLIQDEAVIKINLFLASRVEQLFQYDKDEGPLVVFPAEKGTAPQPTTKERKKQQPRPSKPGLLPKAGRLNLVLNQVNLADLVNPTNGGSSKPYWLGKVLTWGMLGSKVISRGTSSPSGVRPVGCIWSKQNLSQFLLARLNTHANIGSLLGPTLVNTNPINL